MYNITEGFADEITLSNGKKLYTGISSINSHTAKKLKLKVRRVRYKGCCIYANINDRAKDEIKFPIKIDGVDIYTFIDKVADPYEEIK